MGTGFLTVDPDGCFVVASLKMEEDPFFFGFPVFGKNERPLVPDSGMCGFVVNAAGGCFIGKRNLNGLERIRKMFLPPKAFAQFRIICKKCPAAVQIQPGAADQSGSWIIFSIRNGRIGFYQISVPPKSNFPKGFYPLIPLLVIPCTKYFCRGRNRHRGTRAANIEPA